MIYFVKDFTQVLYTSLQCCLCSHNHWQYSVRCKWHFCNPNFSENQTD